MSPASSCFEGPGGIALFEELQAAFWADTPTIRGILAECTKVRTDHKKFARLGRNISKKTNSRVIINFMSVYWSKVNSISDNDKKQIAHSIKVFEDKRVGKLDSCDHHYD